MFLALKFEFNKHKKFLISGEKDNSVQHYLGCGNGKNMVQSLLEMAYMHYAVSSKCFLDKFEDEIVQIITILICYTPCNLVIKSQAHAM